MASSDCIDSDLFSSLLDCCVAASMPAVGPLLAGAQGVEKILQHVPAEMQKVLPALEGQAMMEGPRQPLAMTALLESLQPPAHLADCSHPIIQVNVPRSVPPADTAPV